MNDLNILNSINKALSKIPQTFINITETFTEHCTDVFFNL